MFKYKNSKYFVWVGALVVLVAFFGFVSSYGDRQEVKTLPGKLEISTLKYDFGTIGLDNVSHTFVAKNTGEGPVNITQVSTSCGCTTAKLIKDGKSSVKFGMDHGNLPPANMELEPGEEVEIEVTYNPLAHGLSKAKGYFNRLVYIKTDNPREEHEIMVTMTVDPELGMN